MPIVGLYAMGSPERTAIDDKNVKKSSWRKAWFLGVAMKTRFPYIVNYDYGAIEVQRLTHLFFRCTIADA